MPVVSQAAMPKQKLAAGKSLAPKKPRLVHCQLGSQQCAECCWEKHGASLQQAHFMPDSDVSWLQGYQSSEGLRVGCIACYKLVQQADPGNLPPVASSPFPWFPVATLTGTLKNISRHEKCPGHQQAVRQFWCEAPQDKQLPEEDAAPAEAQWSSLWKVFQSKRYLEQESDQVILRAKARKMMFCLAEALRSRHRVQLRSSECVTLTLDEAKTRLLVRFTSIGQDLKVHRGILGMHRSKATGHQAILASLDHIQRSACTELHEHPQAPSSKIEVVPNFQEELYEHIRQVTQVWNSDAGPDETLAAKESQSISLSVADLRPLLPNIVLVNRDKAHASRRPAFPS